MYFFAIFLQHFNGLYKLIYYSLSQQTKHLRDIASIVKTRGSDLDYDYIQKWAVEKELVDVWNGIRDEIET